MKTFAHVDENLYDVLKMKMYSRIQMIRDAYENILTRRDIDL